MSDTAFLELSKTVHGINTSLATIEANNRAIVGTVEGLSRRFEALDRTLAEARKIPLALMAIFSSLLVLACGFVMYFVNSQVYQVTQPLTSNIATNATTIKTMAETVTELQADLARTNASLGVLNQQAAEGKTDRLQLGVRMSASETNLHQSDSDAREKMATTAQRITGIETQMQEVSHAVNGNKSHEQTLWGLAWPSIFPGRTFVPDTFFPPLYQ